MDAPLCSIGSPHATLPVCLCAFLPELASCQVRCSQLEREHQQLQAMVTEKDASLNSLQQQLSAAQQQADLMRQQLESTRQKLSQEGGLRAPRCMSRLQHAWEAGLCSDMHCVDHCTHVERTYMCLHTVCCTADTPAHWLLLLLPWHGLPPPQSLCAGWKPPTALL